MSGLAQVFVEHLPAPPDVVLSLLEEELGRALRRAHDAWPLLCVPDARFAAELAQRVPLAEPVVEALASMHVEDLYLVVACAAGDGRALAEVERRHAHEIRATVTRMGFSPAVADETLQVMRTELFVAEPGVRPKVLGYAGASELRAWLRAVAARTALRVGRERHPADPLDEAFAAKADADPELGYLQRTYGALFQEVFREALTGLLPGERLLLKQRFRHGMSLQDLGSLYAVHESTASRRVADARARLVAATRDGMMSRLGVGGAEVSSILRLIESQLDVTLSSGAAPGRGQERD